MVKHSKWICRHITLFAVILLGAYWGCPIFRLFGVCCPLCGTTRAWISFLSGEIIAAFRYHLFFLISPAWFFVAAHYNVLFKRSRIIGYLLLCFAFLLAIYNLMRITGMIACVV